MLDTLYTSYTYFLCLLPPNIEKEKLQAKLDTNVRTARENITVNLAFTIISEQHNVAQYLSTQGALTFVYCIILPGLPRCFYV